MRFPAPISSASAGSGALTSPRQQPVREHAQIVELAGRRGPREWTRVF
jgi:hypothetical protein